MCIYEYFRFQATKLLIFYYIWGFAIYYLNLFCAIICGMQHVVDKISVTRP